MVPVFTFNLLLRQYKGIGAILRSRYVATELTNMYMCSYTVSATP